MGRIAARQHGVLSRAQLLEAGFSAEMIDNRVESGLLRPLHRGVYLLGPVMPPLAGEIAAVLACGERSYLSHAIAAHTWSLTPYLPRPRRFEVTVIGRDPRPRAVRVHSVRALEPDETTTHKRIPITTPARTLLDIAPTLTARELERSLAIGVKRGTLRPSSLTPLLARYPRRPGTPALRALLNRDTAPAFTRSEAEERFLAIVREAELPAPEVNAQLGSYEIDFLWRDERLALEVDSWAHHSDRAAFEADRARDADLVSWGFRVIRVTWRQMEEMPVAVVAKVAAALAGG